VFWSLKLFSLLRKKKGGKKKRRRKGKQRKERANGRKKAGRLTFVGGVGGVGGVLLRALISLEFSRERRAK
jgi:hypothetical protein